MTANHIDRAARIIAATDAAERGYELDASDVAIGHTIAMSLDAAGLLVGPEHDAAVAAKAWDEGWWDACNFHGGYTSCGKPDAHNYRAANPYREREGGAS